MTDSPTWRARESGTELPPPPENGAEQVLGPPPPMNQAGALTGQPTPPWPKQPGPLPEPSPTVSVVVLVVAVLANLAARLPAATLMGSVLVLALLGLVVAGRRPNRPVELAATAMTAALGVMLSVRTSPWVTSTTVTAVVALLLLLVADGLALAKHRPWVQAVGRVVARFYDSFFWLRSLAAAVPGADRRRVGAALRAAAVVVLVVFVLGALLASGDAVFANLIAALDPIAGAGHVVLTMLFTPPVAALVLLSRTSEPDDPAGAVEWRSRFETESRAAVWSVATIIGIWCIIQIVVLSGGAEAVLAAEGLSPAEYAREGFFQLVAAAAVSLAVLNGAHRLSRSAVGPDLHQRVPAVLIGLALGGLIVATFGRLWFYMDTFGLTMLRVSVATFLCWLTIMTALSVARSLGLGANLNWLPTVAVLSAAGLALVFAIVNPEALVAATNLDRALVSDEVDVGYLTTLSDDAKETVVAFDWSSLGGRPNAISDWLCDEPARYDYGPLGWNWARRPYCGSA